MSELRTNKIYPRNGLPVGASGGGIIQIVQTVMTAGVTYTNTSFADIPSPGLSVSITPSSSSNKILLIADIACTGASSNYNIFQLVRNSTNIYRGTDSKTYVGTRIWYPRSDGNADGNSMGGVSMHFIDAPGTTSSVTYKVQVRVTDGTGGINRRNIDDTSLASSFTAMEISG